MRASVVITTLNRRDQLAETLSALADQEYPDFEVVVVNGPSTDGTAEMLDRRRDLLRVRDCPVASIGAARNIGIEGSAGDVVAFIDDDARPESPEWLGRLLAPYADPGVWATGGSVFDVPLGRVEWHGCSSTRTGEVRTGISPPFDRYLVPGADPFVYPPGCNMSFRRSALVAIGGFNAHLAAAYDDVEAACRTIDRHGAVVIVDDAGVRHERRRNGWRGDDLEVLDPYPLVHGRAVFALQCERVGPDHEERVRDVLDRWVLDWAGLANQQCEAGTMSDAARERFVERARAGLRDGVAVGRQPRPVADLGPARAIT